MLERPPLAEAALLTHIRVAYGLDIRALVFQPLGADAATAVYRAVTGQGLAYFVKLRRGTWGEATVLVPQSLHDAGLKAIIPALPTIQGELCTSWPPYHIILYPYVTGQNGFERPLTAAQRAAFGAALRRLHDSNFPENLLAGIEREGFAPHFRRRLARLLAPDMVPEANDDLAQAASAFLRAQQPVLLELLWRTEKLAGRISAAPPPFILCHGDCHGWNLLLTDDGKLHIVDWDTLILAPKERDLMFVGSGLGGRSRTLAEEQRHFYAGYGAAVLNEAALAYYRYERIIEDVVLYAADLLDRTTGGGDREAALIHLKSNFRPDGLIAIARRLDQS